MRVEATVCDVSEPATAREAREESVRPSRQKSSFTRATFAARPRPQSRKRTRWFHARHAVLPPAVSQRRDLVSEPNQVRRTLVPDHSSTAEPDATANAPSGRG